MALILELTTFNQDWWPLVVAQVDLNHLITALIEYSGLCCEFIVTRRLISAVLRAGLSN